MALRIVGVVALTSMLLGCTAPEAPRDAGESVFFLVRHAEKVDESQDPPLTEEGERRAAALAETLRDAGVERIYSSDYQRCRETAAPLADRLGLEPILFDPDDLAALAEKLLASPGRSLVVGHSDTTPELAGLLGGEGGTPIADDEYNRLYVLYRRSGSGTSTVLLRYGPLQDRPRPPEDETRSAVSERSS
jgi:phosphohistidine phosphatase SixA